MDKLRITGLQVSATIGVRDWERHVLQRLLIDLEWETDAALAARDDRLADADDYSAVAECARAVAIASRYGLIESLAQAIAEAVLNQYSFQRITVTVHKPSAVPDASDTSIEIQRSR